MGTNQIAPPPGFVVDGQPAGLPPGFVLDSQTKQTPQFDLGAQIQSGMNGIGNFAKGILGGAADLANTEARTVNSVIPFTNANKALVGQQPLTQTPSEVGMQQFNKDNADSTAFQLGKLTSQTAGTAGVSKAFPYIPVKGEGFVQGVKNYLTNVGSGASIGSLINYLTGNDPKDGAVTGATLSAVLPPAVWVGSKVVKYGHNLAEPQMVGGTDQIAGRALNQAAGQQQPEVVQALKNAQSGETAGQAAVPASSPTFSALQQKVQNANVDTSAQYQAIKDAQEAQRLASLRTIGQDNPAVQAPKPNLDAAIAARSADAAKYEAINNTKITPDATFNSLTTRPAFDSALKSAAQSAQERGAYFPTESGQPYTIENLQDVKLALDKAISKPAEYGLQGVKTADIVGTRAKFVNWLEQQSPEWGAARDSYKQMSIPVNQMQIGQYLEKALSSPLEGGAERSAVFAKNIEDASKIIKNSTGQQRYEQLSQIFTPDQMEKVNGVIDQLNRDSRFKELANAGAAPAAKILKETGGTVKLPAILSRPIVIFNELLSRIEGGTTIKTQNDLAKIMQDPQLTAKLMEQASAKEKGAMQLLNNFYSSTPQVTAVGVNLKNKGK